MLPILTAALGVLAFAPDSALAGTADFHLDTTAPAPRRLEVDARWLDIHLSPVSGDQVTVKADFKVTMSGGDARAQKCADNNKVRLETEGDTLIIRQGERDARDSSCSVTLGYSRLEGRIDIGVPAGIPLRLEEASGDVSLSGDFGAATVASRSASGDFTLTGQVRELETEVASGDIRITVDKPLQKLKLESASGSARLKGGAAEVNAQAASGDITLEDLTGPAEVRSASGDISLSWSAVAPASRIDVEAASGGVALTFPSGVTPGGSLSVHSGEIQSDLPGVAGERGRSFKLSGSDAMVTVHTASGDIKLRRR
jgi:DUF4097 and DUF4098 domain-containing protein YvlB